VFPNRKKDIYTCYSHCPFVRGLKARHGISGFYDELFIFKFFGPSVGWARKSLELGNDF
jgi:hypothetical protein